MPDLIHAALFRALRLPRPAVRSIVRVDDLIVPMSDGVELRADRWHPRGKEDAPLLLVRTPYGRRTILGQLYGRLFSQQGFQVIVVACRGTDGSGGDFTRPFAAERQDGSDTVAWLREQPFYPGSFATIGGSYLGYTQMALPAAARAELWGAVLQIAPASVRDVVWPDGGFALHTALAWSASVTQERVSPLRGLLRGRRDAARLLAAGRQESLLDSHVEVTGQRIGFFEQWLTHGPEDDWWEPLDLYGGIADFDCPVLVQSGWYDQFLESSLTQYRALRAAGRPVRISVGPYNHASFPTKGARAAFTEAVDFLRGLAGLSPAAQAPTVGLTLIGSGRNVGLDDWPSASRHERISLSGGTFRYDPADPTPSVGGFLLDGSGGPKVQAEREDRSDVLVFDAPADVSGRDVLGSCEVELWADSELDNAQLFIRLCLVDAKGVSRNVTDRLVALLAEDRDGEGVWHVRVALPPTGLSLAAGERLRLQVSGGSYPFFALGPAVPNRITVHSDARRPSALHVPA